MLGNESSFILTRIVSVGGKEVERESYPVMDKANVAFVEWTATVSGIAAEQDFLVRFEFDPPLSVR